jgi:hypothetical protein
MKTLFRRSLTTFICVGTLIAGTQSWAADAKQTSTVVLKLKRISKNRKCQKPCNMKNDEKLNRIIVSMSMVKCLICPKWIILR